MGKKKYVVESQFEDLHGRPDEDDPDLDVDLSDSKNPIIKAALGRDDDERWQPPEDDEVDDEKDEEDDDDDKEVSDDEDEDDDSEDDDSEEDEGDEDEDDDSEEEDDEDDEPRYSKKVQKRIERERKLRQEAEDAYNRRIRKMEKRLELRDSKDKFRDEERKLEEKLKSLRAKKREALEEGDTDAQIEVDDQILDIKSEMRTGKSKIERLESDLENDDFDDVGSNTPPTGQKWLQSYPEFHSNSKFRDAVLRADQMVAQNGFDKNTDAYYEKIEEIVGVTFPDIVKNRRVKVTRKKGKSGKGGKRKRPAVGGGTKPGTRRKKTTTRTRRGVIRLTRSDQANMRIFGMDPANSEHVKAYAESKE